MGFFTFIKRMAQGQPVFQEQDLTKEPKEQGRPAIAPTASTRKTIPEACVVHEDSRLNGNQLTVDVHIQNNSAQSLHLDDISILGQHHELQRSLDPGQSWEFRIYDGPVPTNDAYDEARLRYRNQGGDYFCTIHSVQYELHGDNQLLVKRIRYLPPVKDI